LGCRGRCQQDVPYSFVKEGTYELRYQILITDQAPLVSETLTITIDTTAPELVGDGALVFPEEVVRDGVTSSYLAANNDRVVASVPRYTDPAPGDVITAYWDTAEGDDLQAVSRTLTAGDYQDEITLTFEGEMIRARGEGTRLVRYRVSDRAGNQSGLAAYVALQVLDEAPEEGLEPPWFYDDDIADAGDNTLFKQIIEAGNGLVVLIPAWQNLPGFPGLDDVVYLEWGRGENPAEQDFEAVDQQTVAGPVDPSFFPLELTLPHRNLLPDGLYSVRYRVNGWNDSVTWSPPVTLVADTTPPRRDSNPEGARGPEAPITDAYLDAHPDGVECTVPAYPDWQPGDRVLFWWLRAPLPDDPTTLVPAGEAEVTAQPQQIIVPASVVTATGDGGCYVIYVLQDKATNISRLSVYTRLGVALGALPQGLLDPEVAQADDGLVDLDDAFAGVIVGIPAFDNWKPTDRVEVTWGTAVLDEEPLGSAPGFPLPVKVPTDVLRAQYGAGEGAVPTPVSYRILRGDAVFGPKQISVDVDFSVVGPELPEWPDPVNPALPVATVFGGDRATPNQLTRQDNGAPATLEFNLYAPVAAGEEVDVYWGDTRVEEARYTVQAGDAPGKLVVVTIPWSYIEQAGNNAALPVHYRIHAPGSPNEQHSPTTAVSVDAVVIIPPAPAFEKLSGNGMLNCTSLDGADRAVLVKVPDLSAYLGAGDTVTLTWTPLAGMTGEEVLDAAIKEEAIVLDAATVRGFVWRVQPYARHILPTYDPDGAGPAGRARINYAFTYKDEPVTSATAEAIVAMFDAAGACPLTQ
jgi:hypothetical protein